MCGLLCASSRSAVRPPVRKLSLTPSRSSPLSFAIHRVRPNARRARRLSALLGEVQGVPVGGGSLYLTFEVCGTDAETEEDVEVPQCRYKLP